ncbi:HNH endonuclease [Candidatus Woesebacteria bacterium]|nr:HNH endonuclease [Candidatus Woesebacteria bacterium]
MKYKGEVWPRGSKSHHWKGGLTKSKTGMRRYIRGFGYIYEHRRIMSEYLGRDLLSEEHVHHIDMDCTNNCIDNLYLFANNSLHMQCHRTAQEVGFQLLNRHVWFNRDTVEYVLKPVHAAAGPNVFYSWPGTRFYNRRLVNGSYKTYEFFHQKKEDGSYISL